MDILVCSCTGMFWGCTKFVVVSRNNLKNDAGQIFVLKGDRWLQIEIILMENLILKPFTGDLVTGF